MQYLVDSDWVIDYLHGDEPVFSRLTELLPEGVGLSLIALGEVYEGVAHSPSREADERELREFLKDVELVGLDEEVVLIFGAERARLRAGGKLIPNFDLLIGATALRHDLVMLTNNLNHFERIEGLTIVSTLR